MTDWYERRNELGPDQVFRCHDGEIVKLDRTIPGDGTAWYAATWWGSSWAHMDAHIEPGELAERLPDDYRPAA